MCKLVETVGETSSVYHATTGMYNKHTQRVSQSIVAFENIYKCNFIWLKITSFFDVESAKFSRTGGKEGQLSTHPHNVGASWIYKVEDSEETIIQ